MEGDTYVMFIIVCLMLQGVFIYKFSVRLYFGIVLKLKVISKHLLKLKSHF